MTTPTSPTHPIVELAIQGLRKSGRDGYQLGAEQLRVVEAALAAIKVVSEARRAVRELIQFAWLMETEQHSPRLARALVAAIREVVVGLAARDVRFQELSDELEASAARFARFNGDKTALRAPRAGEHRSGNCRPLAALVPVMLR